MVAEADRLAVAGSRAGGAEGAQLSRRAADLRRRAWRIDGRRTDGLEALELYRSASSTDWEGACAAALDGALLAAEVHSDPAEAFRTVYVLRKRNPETTCAARAERALRALRAFEPLPTDLVELDREATGPDPEPAPPASAAAAPGSPTVVKPPPETTPSKGPLQVTSVERYGAKEAARIVVNLTRAASYDVGVLPASAGKPPRIYADIAGARYAGRTEFDVGGIVRRVRMGKRKGETRVVLDLASAAYHRVFYLPEPFRLVIDVSKDPPRFGELADGPRSVRRVVIDPGHGGKDPGAVGPGGLREKDVTLDIAHRAAPLIARELGIVTLLTRDADVFVPLDERTARANAFGADLFISIHCNAAEVSSSRGVMTFVLDVARDADATRIAARENAASAAAGKELARVMRKVLGGGGAARSAHFAGLLQRSTMASLRPHYADIPNGGVKRAGFYVLAGAHMPAVLYETSFISNPVDETRLDTADFRQKMADAIVNAIRAYREGR